MEIDNTAPESRDGQEEQTGRIPAPNDVAFRIWSTRKYGTAREVIAKWNRGELGPEHDPWNQVDDPAASAEPADPASPP